MSDCLSKGWQGPSWWGGERGERRKEEGGSQQQQQQQPHGVKVEGSSFFLCLSFPFPLWTPSRLAASLARWAFASCGRRRGVGNSVHHHKRWVWQTIPQPVHSWLMLLCELSQTVWFVLCVLHQWGKSFAGCFHVFNCKSSVALTRITVQANEDECFPFTLQSPAVWVCVYVGGNTVHFKV